MCVRARMCVCVCVCMCVEGRAAQICPEWCFKFALNAVTDTLPHNAKLYKWKKLSSPRCQLCGEHQFLAHVLNSCQKALDLRRYTIRHDDVLAVIFDFCKCHLPPGLQITADLPGQYNFPQDIATTDQHPDIVIWSATTILVELTVPFETNVSIAAERKVQLYKDLRDACLTPTTPTSSHWRSAREVSSSSTDCFMLRPKTGSHLSLT